MKTLTIEDEDDLYDALLEILRRIYQKIKSKYKQWIAISTWIF